MPPWLTKLILRTRATVKPGLNWLAGSATVLLLKLIRRTDPDRISRFGGRLLRRIGPWLPENKVGRDNLTRAFPEKTPAEIEALLGDVWENLGRLGAEYAHLDRLWDFDLAHPVGSRIEIPPETIAHFTRLREDGKPALFFAAHLSNWELPGVAAAANNLETAVLYRAPNIGDIADALQSIRAINMGTLIPTGYDAAFKVAAALERGTHVGMLVDQHFSRGVDITFFGRPCKANPMLARLARRFPCPIHGARVIRLPGNRFRLEITDEVIPVYDAKGEIDVVGTTQRINDVIEGWVRENPEQWLWLHRRWR